MKPTPYSSVLFSTALIAGSMLGSSIEAAAPEEKPLPAQVRSEQAVKLRELSPKGELRFDSNGIPTRLEAALGKFRRDQAESDTRTLLGKIKGGFRLDGSEALQIRKSSRDVGRGVTHHRMSQTINGRRVIGGEIILHVEEATEEVVGMDSQLLPGTGLPRRASVSSQPALIAAVRDRLSGRSIELKSQPELAYARTREGSGHLVWSALIEYMDAQGRRQLDEILVDATSGAFVRRLPQRHQALYRQIYHHDTNQLLIAEGGTTNDAAAQAIYSFAAQTYAYFLNNFGRDSWNAGGAAMRAFVHGTPAGDANALFDCTTGVAHFGDGDGATFGSLAVLDIAAHEWGHGITCSEAALVYTGESGAINESMSDVFGMAVEASVHGLSSSTWQMGEAAYTPGIAGDAFRYVSNPALDGHSRDFYPEMSEAEDVHHTSGIGNLAFYLTAMGGSHPNGKSQTQVRSIGLNNAVRIWYLSLRDYLLPDSGYVDLREATDRTAREQFGASSPERAAVCAAWDAVGVPNPAGQCPRSIPPGLFSVINLLLLD